MCFICSVRGFHCKLGNILRTIHSSTPPTTDNEGKSPEIQLKSKRTSAEMEKADPAKEDIMMDFESGIDTWIIDKDDSVGSITITNTDKARKGSKEKNVDKENITQSSQTSDRKSLRCFRIRKRVSYQELSSESDSDSKKAPDDKDDLFLWSKKRRSESTNVSKAKTNVESSASLFTSTESRREKESLGCDEISLILTEDSTESFQGSNREKLHSIENVSSLIDNKGDSLSLPVKLNFKCNLCNCEYHSSEELKLHEETHKNRYESLYIPADQSNQRVISGVGNKLETTGSKSNKNSLVKPVKSLTTQTKTLQCEICGYRSAELLIYKSHQIMFHSDETKLECEYCDYKTTQCANLATHIRIHFQMDCPYCDYHCSLRSSLEAHLLRYHQSLNPYKCKKCGYTCKSQNKFYKHLQHHGVRKFQCGECKRFLSSKQSLKMHVKKHIPTNTTFECGECELRFSQKQSLKLHMKCHEKLTGAYTCNTCNSSFKKKNHLIIHSKIHMNIPKNFRCEKCDLSFTQINYLTLHKRIHIPKYTKCKYCTFQCANSNDFSNHICVPVNKLYHVQKRSLKFEKATEDEAKPSKIKIQSSEIIEKSLFKDEDKHQTTSESTVEKSKSDVKKQTKKKRLKVLALRQTLRSRKILRKNGIIGEKKNGELDSDSLKSDKAQVRMKKKTDKNKPPCLVRNNSAKTTIKNNSYKTHAKSINSSSNDNDSIIAKLQKKNIKKARKQQLLKSGDCTKVLFDQKQTLKDMLLEPIRLANSSYIECYYQSQQPTSAASIQDHQERHLRRNSLLSCRYCNYKTNSQQLLKLHNDKNHSWDPAVVSKLFR